jgi:hypothetical protein
MLADRKSGQAAHHREHSHSGDLKLEVPSSPQSCHESAKQIAGGAPHDKTRYDISIAFTTCLEGRRCPRRRRLGLTARYLHTGQLSTGRSV